MSYVFKPGDQGKTRDGRPYRVLATDVKSHQPLLAAIIENIGIENIYYYDSKGNWDGIYPNSHDLLPPTRIVVVEQYIIYFQEYSGVVSSMTCFDNKELDYYHELASMYQRKHLRTVKITETFELPVGDNK